MVDFLGVPLLLVEPGSQAEVNRSHNLSHRFPRHLRYCKKGRTVLNLGQFIFNPQGDAPIILYHRFFGFTPPPSLNSDIRRWYFQTERGSNT